jgi:hypothetical protein
MTCTQAPLLRFAVYLCFTCGTVIQDVCKAAAGVTLDASCGRL